MNHRINLILFWVFLFCTGLGQDRTDVIRLIDRLENEPELFDSVNYEITQLSHVDLDRSLEVSRYFLRKSVAIQNNQCILSALSKTAVVFILRGELDSATIYLDKSQELLDDVDNKLMESQLYYRYGWYYSELGQNDFAEEAYYHALKLAEELEDYEMQITLLSSMGLTAIDVNKKVIALGHMRKGLQIAEKHNLKNTEAYYNLLYNTASIYQVSSMADSSIILYNELMDIYQKRNDPMGMAGISNNLGSIYKADNKYDEAIWFYKKALALDQKTGSQSYIMVDIINLGEVYLLLNQLEKAEYYLLTADSMAEMSGISLRRIKLKNLLSDLYVRKNNYRKGYDYLSQYSELKEQQNLAEIRERIEKVEKKYQLEKKEKENQILLVEKKDNEMVINRQRIFLFFAVLLLFVLFISYLVIGKRNKKIKGLNAEITEKNRELKKSNATKNRFFSIIAHDLKGPVGNLDNMLDLMVEEEENMDPEHNKRILNTVSNTTKNIYELLINLLTWSRSQFQELQVNKENVNLREVLEDCVHLMEQRLTNKRIDLIKNYNQDLLIFVDEEMLSFIIRNILSNAIKFTHPGGQIWIDSFRDESRTWLKITDNGTGMDEKTQKSLFQIENYKSTPGTQGEKGTGLGLLLCKDFADRNDIIIHLESKPAEGTAFTFEIPA